jgi:hypothetical protein
LNQYFTGNGFNFPSSPLFYFVLAMQFLAKKFEFLDKNKGARRARQAVDKSPISALLPKFPLLTCHLSKLRYSILACLELGLFSKPVIL